MAEIEKLAENTYRLSSVGRSLTLSAQDMLNIMDFCLLNAAKLEREAKQQQQQQGTNGKPKP